MTKWIGLFLSLVLITLSSPAFAEKLVVKKKRGSTQAVVTLDPKSVHVDEEGQITITLMTIAHVEGSKTHEEVPITDATVEAHLGHGKPADSSVMLAHDDAAKGTYRGSITFAHAGKETLHLGVTLVGEREWTIRLNVNVKRKDKD